MAASRRRFVTDTCRAACAIALLPLAACARKNTSPPHSPSWLRTSPSIWDKRIPELLAQTKVPGLSIAVVTDAALAWRRCTERPTSNRGADL